MLLRSFTEPKRKFLSKTLEDSFFESRAAVDVEIGCGVGWHSICYAKNYPDRKLIAIEHGASRFERFERRYVRSGSPKNLVPVHANAISWIYENLPENSIENIFFLYPNPYPKQSQRNKRWHAMPFMGKLLKKLKPSGHLHLATNSSEYAREAKKYYLIHWGLSLLSKSTINKQREPDFSPRTHFEKKFFERGENCFDLVFQKKGLEKSPLLPG